MEFKMLELHGEMFQKEKDDYLQKILDNNTGVINNKLFWTLSPTEGRKGTSLHYCTIFKRVKLVEYLRKIVSQIGKPL